jgi:ABC-2 type transport system ATP-binding protein
VSAVRDQALAGRAARALRAADLNVEVQGTRLICTDDRAVQQPEQVATLLVQAGTPPSHLALEREDLEQHFLRLTDGGPS